MPADDQFIGQPLNTATTSPSRRNRKRKGDKCKSEEMQLETLR